MTLDFWPDARQPAEFGGAEAVHRGPGDGEPAAVLQRWHTNAGDVVVACEIKSWSVNGMRFAEWAPEADTYVQVGSDWGRRGPALWGWAATDPGADKGSTAGPTWRGCWAVRRRSGRGANWYARVPKVPSLLTLVPKIPDVTGHE